MTTVEAFEGGWRDAARSDGIRAQEITMMAESIQRRLEAVLTATTPGDGG